jgi:integrase
MRWADIDLRNNIWHVPHVSAKNGEPVSLPLIGPALEILKRRRTELPLSPWVFPSERGKSGHITSPKLAWADLLKRAQIDDLHLHDLRRSLASWMAMSGHSLLEIGRALGHRDPRSTAIYARLQINVVGAAVNKAQELMLAQRSTNPVVAIKPKG